MLARLRRKKSASCTGAASSVVTTTNVVRLSCSTRDTASARSTKPGAIVSNSRKNSEMSERNWLPMMRSATMKNGFVVMFEHPAPGRGGEQSEEAAREEIRHPLRRPQEVEGVAGRWRVDDDEVVDA